MKKKIFSAYNTPHHPWVSTKNSIYSVQPFGQLYIYIACLGVCMSVCLFVCNKRQNGWTDRAQFFCGTSRDHKEGLWMIKISNIYLHQNSIFIKFLKILKIHKIFCENPRIIFVLFYDVHKENMFTITSLRLVNIYISRDNLYFLSIFLIKEKHKKNVSLPNDWFHDKFRPLYNCLNNDTLSDFDQNFHADLILIIGFLTKIVKHSDDFKTKITEYLKMLMGLTLFLLWVGYPLFLYTV